MTGRSIHLSSQGPAPGHAVCAHIECKRTRSSMGLSNEKDCILERPGPTTAFGVYGPSPWKAKLEGAKQVIILCFQHARHDGAIDQLDTKR
ncbi:hypothetical protein DPEC_G00370780 [Dallia pectoralis]|nr:hypothetical protein DPEC_G00370780 [Dallia pectoralis]